MNRYEAKFAQLKARNEGAFVPFVTLGDPSPKQSLAIIKALIDAGADALELGLPFSDPVADGPTIQRANLRALASHTGRQDCLDILTEVRAYAPDLPIGLLLYANLAWSQGIDSFYKSVAAVGVDSVLLADVPVKEGQRFVALAKQYQIAPIFIAPPDASDATLTAVAKASEGYIYLLSRAGVTGAGDTLVTPATTLIEKLKAAGGPPPLLGFGVAKPEHVKAALQAGAAGAISGSAVVQRIEEHLTDDAAMLAALTQFVREMKAATQVD